MSSAFETNNSIENTSPEIASHDLCPDSTTHQSSLEISYREDTELDSVLTGDSLTTTPLSVLVPGDQLSQSRDSCLNEKMSTSRVNHIIGCV